MKMPDACAFQHARTILSAAVHLNSIANYTEQEDRYGFLQMLYTSYTEQFSPSALCTSNVKVTTE